MFFYFFALYFLCKQCKHMIEIKYNTNNQITTTRCSLFMNQTNNEFIFANNSFFSDELCNQGILYDEKNRLDIEY
jgi:hypothetical protein